MRVAFFWLVTMRVVLVRPSYQSHKITPPLGLGYLSSFLKRRGVETKIMDGLRDNLTNEQLVKMVLELKPDAVGITCLTDYYKEVVDLARRLKKHHVRCIIGGVHPTFLPYETLKDSGADYVVCGEGELAMAKLVCNEFSNDRIQGVYTLSDFEEKNMVFGKGELIDDLDSIPFPDWEEIDPNCYPKAPHGGIVRNFPIGVVTTSRGCPYECTFCASSRFYDRKIRFRSAENIIQEIVYLKKNFGVQEIHFEDDNLTLDKEHIEKICHLLIERGIELAWSCPNGVRADKVDSELLLLMKRSGCYCLAYGIESANNRILGNVRKQVSTSVVEESIKMASDLGICCVGFFIFGLPGETRESVQESIAFAKKSGLSRAQFLVLSILPGSELWDRYAKNFGTNWSKDDCEGPAWLTSGLSKKDLIRLQGRAFRQFYLRPKIFFSIIGDIRPGQIPHLLQRLVYYRVAK
jgi:anaerobic magnesium-protoporphyrin IX monomethyl ester cyclase